MDLEFRLGPMAPSTRENGNKTKPMARANSGMRMAMFTRANGSKTKPTDTGFMSISMAPDMRASGGMTFRMVLVKRAGKTVQATPEDTWRA